MDFTVPLSITGVAVVGFIFLRRPLGDLIDRMESLAWIGLKAPHRHDHHPTLPESQSAIQPEQLESALASEQRHRDHEAQIIASHAKQHEDDARTITENEKVIKRLTILNTVKDKDIARLTASNAEKDVEIARLKKQIPPPQDPRIFKGFQ